jgi:hypothetical protein
LYSKFKTAKTNQVKSASRRKRQSPCTPAEFLSLQTSLQFRKVTDEPDIRASIGFVPERRESGTLSAVARHITDNGEVPSVLHELLNDLTRNARPQAEEFVPEPLNRNHDEPSSKLQCFAYQFHRVAITAKLLPIGCTL